jgi:hypothetical protein
LLGEGTYKASKGLIRVKIEVATNMIKKIQISGDFFMYPEDALWELERFLVGTAIKRREVLTRVQTFYERTRIVTPGVAPEDITEAITRSFENRAP